MLLKSACHQLFCMKYSFKLVTFPKSYARKQKWVSFSEHNEQYNNADAVDTVSYFVICVRVLMVVCEVT